MNSEIERGFSWTKRIKTGLRSELSVWRLQGLMMISLNGDDIKVWRLDESYHHLSPNNDLANFQKKLFSTWIRMFPIFKDKSEFSRFTERTILIWKK